MMRKIIHKIFYNLLKPHKIFSKILKKIKFYSSLKKYNQNSFESIQNNYFEELGLDRKRGTEKLKSIMNDFNLSSDMSSEHENIFSSISLNKSFEIKNILEIGTYDGANALLLSKVFPNSEIDTIDLDEEDDEFKNFYNRKNKIEDFIKKRNFNILKGENINFIKMNSLNLINHKKKYDLIWIDGAHGYPLVCIDIINSINLINNNGLILCDDIYVNIDHNDSDKMYKSLAAYETLFELKKQNIVDFKLIYKRLNPEYNCLKEERKFIAILNKQ